MTGVGGVGAPGVLRLGRRTFGPREIAVMAIINRTPDSFYDAGSTFTDPAALAAVDRAVAQGADLVDVGGVPAGEGPQVDVAEELRRVVGFIAVVRDRYPELVISVDTWRAEVAAAACAHLEGFLTYSHRRPGAGGSPGTSRSRRPCPRGPWSICARSSTTSPSGAGPSGHRPGCRTPGTFPGWTGRCPER